MTSPKLRLFLTSPPLDCDDANERNYNWKETIVGPSLRGSPSVATISVLLQSVKVKLVRPVEQLDGQLVGHR